MCVEKRDGFRCRWAHINMLKTTITIGLVYSILALINALLGLWTWFAVSTLFAFIILTICCKPKNERFHKIRFYMILALIVLKIIFFITWTIYVFNSDWAEDRCSSTIEYLEFNDWYSSYKGCVDWVKTVAIIFAVCFTVFGIPWSLCVL